MADECVVSRAPQTIEAAKKKGKLPPSAIKNFTTADPVAV